MPNRGKASAVWSRPFVLLSAPVAVGEQPQGAAAVAADPGGCAQKPACHCWLGAASGSHGCFVIWMLKRSSAQVFAGTCQEVEKQQTNKPGLSSSVMVCKFCHRQKLTLFYLMFGFSVKSDVGMLCLPFFLDTVEKDRICWLPKAKNQIFCFSG